MKQNLKKTKNTKMEVLHKPIRMGRNTFSIRVKSIERNNPKIPLHALFVENNWKEIKQAYIWKHNSNLEYRVVLLMITDGEKWHDLAFRKLSTMLRGIISKYNDDYYCINCLHSSRTKKTNLNHIKIMIIAT